MKLSKVISIALVSLWVIGAALGIVFVSPKANAQPIPGAGGSGCRAGTTCSVSRLTATSTTNPIIVSTNGEVCLNGSACTVKCVYDGTSVDCDGAPMVVDAIHAGGAIESRNISMTQRGRFYFDGTAGSRYMQYDNGTGQIGLFGARFDFNTGARAAGGTTFQTVGGAFYDVAQEVTLTTDEANGAGALGLSVNINNDFTTAGALAMRIRDNTGATPAVLFTVDKDGTIGIGTHGDSTGTPGAATLNTATGKSAVASGSASVVITNAIVAASSKIFITPITDTANCRGAYVSATAAGSFTVTCPVGNAGANWSFNWLVISDS
jgi:hypothetical protein